MPLRRPPARLTVVGWSALLLGIPNHAALVWLLFAGDVGNATAVLDGPPPDTLERVARAAGVVARCEAA